MNESLVQFKFAKGDRVCLKGKQQAYIVHSVIPDPTDGRDGLFEQYRLTIPELAETPETWHQLAYRNQIELFIGQLNLLEEA